MQLPAVGRIKELWNFATATLNSEPIGDPPLTLGTIDLIQNNLNKLKCPKQIPC